MSTVLDSFVFGYTPVRIIIGERGEPWFVAKDVCEILEIENHRDAASRLDEDQRGSVLVDTPGGKQEMSAVTESGLYELIFRSNKPEARSFRKWITAEVLPSIRKKGGYGAGLSMDEVRQIVRLPEPYKRDAFRRLLAEAGRQPDKSDSLRQMLNVCLIFATAETGGQLEQCRMTF